MICGSCAMRIDGVTVLACKHAMRDIAEAGKVPVISPMGNLPIVRDLVVDMDPFWAKFRAVDPYLKPGYNVPPAGQGARASRRERMAAIHKESLCINCGACVSECNAMESSPEFLGPQALAKAMRFVGDPRDGAKNARLEAVNGEHGIWECTRCYFCNERCPKGVDPRDAIAKLGAESIKEGIDRDMGAKHAKWFVTSAKTTGWLRETELVPKTQGIVESIRQTQVRARPAEASARCRRRSRRTSPRTCASRARLHDLLYEQDRARVRRGIVQGERALAKLVARRSTRSTTIRTGRASFPQAVPAERAEEGQASHEAGRVLQGLPGLALGEGARLLDAGAGAAGRPRADRARVGHLLRRRRHPRGRAGLLPPPERADPRLCGGDGLGHAADGLQRLHAQPAAGELPADRRRGAPRPGEREPARGRRRRRTSATSTSGTCSGSSPTRRASRSCRRRRTRG